MSCCNLEPGSTDQEVSDSVDAVYSRMVRIWLKHEEKNKPQVLGSREGLS